MWTVEQIKESVWYYLGLRATNEEAEEILDFISEKPGTSVDEIIADYYNC